MADSATADSAEVPPPTAAVDVEEYFHGDEPAGAYAWGAHPAGEFLQAVFWHLRDENRWDPAAAFELTDGMDERSVQRGFWRREPAMDGGEPKLVTCLPTDEGAEAVTFVDWGGLRMETVANGTTVRVLADRISILTEPSGSQHVILYGVEGFPDGLTAFGGWMKGHTEYFAEQFRRKVEAHGDQPVTKDLVRRWSRECVDEEREQDGLRKAGLL